jgi:hypothetical protein
MYLRMQTELSPCTKPITDPIMVNASAGLGSKEPGNQSHYINADAFKKTASGFNYLVGFLLFLV